MKSLVEKFKRLVEHPTTRGMDIDAPETTGRRKEIILNKKFLKYIYLDWYKQIDTCFSSSEGLILEIGSGAGFSEAIIPNVIKTDVLEIPGIQAVAGGGSLPFRDESLAGITTVNVLHHLPAPRAFFTEASRTVKKGGKIVMIEPWATRFSSFIYKYFHHERFDLNAEKWEFSGQGPLSEANSAIPWIIFERDRPVFRSEFKDWQISQIKPMMPIRYLLSGGISLRFSAPGTCYPAVSKFEELLEPWIDNLAMFALIELTKSKI